MIRKNLDSRELYSIRSFELTINSYINMVNSKKSDIRKITSKIEQILQDLSPEVRQKIITIIDLQQQQQQQVQEKIDEYNEELENNKAYLHSAKMFDDISNRFSVTDRLQKKSR
jgi:low affinity Fe/Cu permease